VNLTGYLSRMDEVQIRRLQVADVALARELFLVMGRAFEEPRAALSDAYLQQLLQAPSFWALAAVRGEQVLGGLTAHTLPMTRNERSELFIYDIAVAHDARRRGIGRMLIEAVCALAAEGGIDVAFVPAEADDTQALDFYRALGADAADVVHFTFGDD
jgi:aminoglycoside 3-N-acetyltransferase I